MKERKMPALTKIDVEIGLVDANYFQTFSYLLDFEILKRKLSIYKMNHTIELVRECVPVY
jgi:ABC-type metal ion transport system substrate-binding protein